MHLSFSELLILVAIVAALIYFGLKKAGLWNQAKGTAFIKTKGALDGATTGVEKKKIEVNQLADLLNQLGGEMTTLDGKLGAAQGDVVRAQSALDAAVEQLHNVQAVIADPNNMSADESTTLNAKASAVAAAESTLAAKKTLVAELSKQCAQLHDDYQARKAEDDAKAAEIPAAEVKQVLTQANNIAASFGKRQEEFKQAAALGSDADAQIDADLAKSKSEAALHGGQTDTERAAAKAAAASKTSDVLARYGKPGAATTPTASK